MKVCARDLESPFLEAAAWPAEPATGQEARLLQETPYGGAVDADSLIEAEFRTDRLPAAVRQQFNLGPAAWRTAVTAAISAGIRNPSDLANLMFFMQDAQRLRSGVGKPIAVGDADFHKARAEWNLYRSIATGMLDPRAACSVFLPAAGTGNYETYVAAPTTGRITLLLNGRDSGGSAATVDHAEAFDSMQKAVESLGRNDTLYLSTWQFKPFTVELTTPGPPGMKNWGELLTNKAREGVKIRIIMSDFSSRAAGFKSDLTALQGLVTALPQAARDNFKYIVSMHSARVLLFGEVGTHHQKFMVLRRRGVLTGYCGGLDLAAPRSPASWNANGWIWHDVHAKLEGLIVCDLEREFVLRWNREKGSSTAPKLADWKDYETLTVASPVAINKARDRNVQRIQMQRTVAVGIAGSDIRRDDIWQGYFRLIGCAKQFLYLENQYFREPQLADAIVKQTQARTDLIVIVVASTESDDPSNQLTEHGRALQHEFFLRLLNGIPAARLRIYTMFKRLVHSKIIFADDRAVSMGSANANPRGFFLDSELNLMVDDVSAARTARQRLWSHNLGVSVAGWAVADFIARWDSVAKANEKLTATPEAMTGEGVIPHDPRTIRGNRHPIADVLTET